MSVKLITLAVGVKTCLYGDGTILFRSMHFMFEKKAGNCPFRKSAVKHKFDHCLVLIFMLSQICTCRTDKIEQTGNTLSNQKPQIKKS